tara:strand:+ start:38 stop:751 length:714 start_codon:yes stop_codon:yes gene_type:complete
MADKKITSMNTTTAPAASDLMLVVVDPSGTPLNKTVTITNLANTVANQHKTGNTVQSNVDGVDTVFKQYDGTEVARIYDGAVVPTVSGTTYTLSAGTGFGFRRRILTLSAGGGNNLTLTAADSGAIIYVTPTEPVDLILPLVGTETGIWFEIIFAAKVNKAFEIKTSGQDGNDNITVMNQYVGPSQNFDVGGSDHDVLYIANANIGTRIEIINCAGGAAEKWHAYVRSLGSQAATIS